MSVSGKKSVHMRRLCLALAVGVVVAGCDTGREPVGPVASAPAAASLAGSTAETVQRTSQEFARVLALALKQPGTRGVLHQAMRESRFNEHKLVLQEFLATGAGERLVRAMAEAGGVEEATVRGWARQLPRMDFYVPFVEHRRNWTGTGDLVVGANVDVDQTRFTGYTPEGAALQFDAAAGAPRQAVIFLHPAEPKGVRAPHGPAQGNGRTIEDPSEPVSTLYMVDEGECDPTTAIVECNGGGGGSGPGSTTPATYQATLVSFRNYRGDGIGGIELMVKHYAGQGGSRIDEQIMEENSHFTWTGYEYDDVTTPNASMNFMITGTTWIKVWERDSGAESFWGASDSDFWGEGAFGGWGPNNYSPVHRFYTDRLVAYYSGSGDPCWRVYECPNLHPTVDIIYRK